MSVTNGGQTAVLAGEQPAPQVGGGFLAFLKSHPTGFWFIFWGEFAERCSFYGMKAILATYMADKLGFGKANAGTYMAFFMGAAYFLPMIGGYLADNYFGKYRTIVAFSLPYILGHVILSFENQYCLFFALCLLAMGAGVIKPNISTLMGLTYDQQRPGKELLRTQAFSMFYMSINIGAAISQLVIPDIKDTYGYVYAFLFPAILMAVAFLIFAAGKRFYAVEVIQHKKKTPEEFAQMKLTFRKIAGVFLLVMFFWAIFDQSSSTWIFFGQTYQTNFSLPLLGQMTPERIQSFNPVLIVLLLPFVTYLWTVLEKRGVKVKATTKLQAGFFLTAICMGIMAVPGFKAGPLETLFVPIKADAVDSAKVEVDKHLPIAYDAACIISSAGTAPAWPTAVTGSALPYVGKEVYVRPENKVSLWWQGLTYLIMTIAEILISVTGLEMAFVVAPKFMKGFITSLWLLTVALANWLLNAPLGQLYPRMHPGIYFLLLTGMMTAVMIAFWFVARRYERLAQSSHPVSPAT